MYEQSLDIGSGILKPRIKKRFIYLLTFLAAFHITPAIYVNSIFLGQFISDEKVGFIFTISSILVLILFSKIKNILRFFGNYKVFITTIWVDILSLCVMSSSFFINESRFAIIFIAAYIVGYVSRIVMLLCLDIFLENQSIDTNTGKIRGLYLTALNFAYVVGPIIAGFLIIDSVDLSSKAAGITPVYIFAVLLLFPMLFIARKYLKHFVDSDYKKEKIVSILGRISHDFDLVKVCSTNFILSFFYSWMIIYTPIFLTTIGFEISDVVTIIGFALIAFMLFQLPAGRIADKFIGEKEIMTVGFVIAGIATISMSFISSTSFWVWTGIIFTTRIGASMIEIMNETYLFKKINDQDVDILSLYRSVSESAYVIAPVVASILLTFVLDIKYIFIVLGAIVLYGIRFSITLKDTK